MQDAAHHVAQGDKPQRALDQGWVRGTTLALALAAAILIGLGASGWLVDIRGVDAGSVILATSKGGAIAVFAVVLLLATLVGCIVGRLVNAVVGTFVVGCALAALSMRSGAVDAPIFDGVPLASLGMETLMWSLPAAIAVSLVFLAAGPLPDVPRRSEEGPLWREYFDIDAWRAGLTGVLLPVVAWLLVRSMMKGQALGGACAGGIAVGIAFRMIAPRIQPVVAFVTPIAFMGIYQWMVAGRGLVGADGLFAAGVLPPGMRVMPLDTVAGTFVGVAIGIGWARSFRKTDTIHS